MSKLGSASPLSISAVWARFWRTVALIPTSGLTLEVSRPILHNLRWFWSDGVFANASESILNAYLSIFVLALGATRGQIGLVSALSNLSAALLLLPGAALVERWGRRKQVVVLSGGGLSRIIILLLALLPFGFAGTTAVLVALSLMVLRSAATNLSLPAWVSLTADMVPLQWRGRYFSSRNMAMAVAGMATTYLAGVLITGIGDLPGYQAALGVAFGLGIVSTFSFNKLQEPAPAVPEAKPAAQESLRQIFGRHPQFLAFCAVASVWNASLNIAGPFFNVYLVEGLRADAGIVGVLSVINSVAGLAGQRVFGRLVDRWKPRRVQLLTGLLIPLFPAVWAVINAPWQVAPLNVFAGFLWAGYDLSTFNSLLLLTPQEQRARYSAVYQIVVTLSLAGGAAMGSLIATQWGYPAVFIVSAAGRLVAALLFARSFTFPG